MIYAPPTISAGGFRLHSSRPSPNSPFLGPGTALGAGNSVVSDLTGVCGDSLDRLPGTAGDGYLAPLLRPQQHQQQQQHHHHHHHHPNPRAVSHRPFSGPSPTQHPGFPHSHSANSSRYRGRTSPSLFSAPSSSSSAFHLASQTSDRTNSSAGGGAVLLDSVGFTGSTAPQPPRSKSVKNTRVFYKPGSASANNNTNNKNNNRAEGPDPASQALLHNKRQEEKSCPHLSATPSKDSDSCEQCQEGDDEEEEDDVKRGLSGGGARVALPLHDRAKSKKVSYTHLPRPSV